MTGTGRAGGPLFGRNDHQATPTRDGAAATRDRTLEMNAYAISYRLIGDRPLAAAVAGIAAERVRQQGGTTDPDWMRHLVLFTLEQTVGPGAPEVIEADDDPFAGIRAALRRRLSRATAEERVAGALIHLAGYPADFVAQVLHRPPEEVAALARVLAPPPGVVYRHLGDPNLTGTETPQRPGEPTPRRRRPSWTTIVVVLLVLLAVLGATQITGPRPTLGPPATESGAAEVSPEPPQRNGGPLTHATRE